MHGAALHRKRSHGHNQRQSRCAIQRNGELILRVEWVDSMVERRGHKNWHRVHQQQHDDEGDEQCRIGHDRFHVNGCAGNHEKHGNKEAIAHAFELRVQCMVAVRRDESQDEAGRERAQHHIKLEQERQTQFAEQFNGFGHLDFI